MSNGALRIPGSVGVETRALEAVLIVGRCEVSWRSRALVVSPSGASVVGTIDRGLGAPLKTAWDARLES